MWSVNRVLGYLVYRVILIVRTLDINIDHNLLNQNLKIKNRPFFIESTNPLFDRLGAEIKS